MLNPSISGSCSQIDLWCLLGWTGWENLSFDYEVCHKNQHQCFGSRACEEWLSYWTSSCRFTSKIRSCRLLLRVSVDRTNLRLYFHQRLPRCSTRELPRFWYRRESHSFLIRFACVTAALAWEFGENRVPRAFCYFCRTLATKFAGKSWQRGSEHVRKRS